MQVLETIRFDLGARKQLCKARWKHRAPGLLEINNKGQNPHWLASSALVVAASINQALVLQLKISFKQKPNNDQRQSTSFVETTAF